MKNKKRKLTEAEEKDAERFVERFAEILIMQIENEELEKRDKTKVTNIAKIDKH